MKDSHPQSSITRATQPADEEKGADGPSPSLHGLSYDNGTDTAYCGVQGEVARNMRAWLKMDCTVLPIVTGIFFLCFLDRGNIGNARIAGLQEDLNMSNYQYSLALTITFIPYILIELPTNLLLKRIGPNVILPLMTVLWGITTTLEGTITSYGGLIACRFFIGLFEGGLSPGCMLYLSTFYPRLQLQLRISIYFIAPTIAGAFSGLLASAILHMDGIGGKPGWAWVFILEGLLTVLFGFLAFFILPRTPSQVPLLTSEEKAFVARVLHEETNKLFQPSMPPMSQVGDSKRPNVDVEVASYASDEKDSKVKWQDVWRALTLPHIWLIAVIIGLFQGATLNGLTYFTPSIVASLGYMANQAQLMSVPPFAVSLVFAVVSSYLSDRYAKRGLTIIICALLSLAGFGIFIGSHHPHARYASLFLIIPGTYAMVPPLATLISNNTHFPYTTRATSIALLTIATNTGGIFSTWLLGSWSKPPGYVAAGWVLGMSQVGITASAIACWVLLRRANELKGTHYIM